MRLPHTFGKINYYHLIVVAPPHNAENLRRFCGNHRVFRVATRWRHVLVLCAICQRGRAVRAKRFAYVQAVRDGAHILLLCHCFVCFFLLLLLRVHREWLQVVSLVDDTNRHDRISVPLSTLRQVPQTVCTKHCVLPELRSQNDNNKRAAAALLAHSKYVLLD